MASEEKKAKDRAYYLANRERILARHKERSSELRAYMKRWHAANPPEPGERAEYMRKYAEANKQRLAEYLRGYRKREDKARKREAHAAWRKAHPEMLLVYQTRRRARKAGGGGSHTIEERREKFAALGDVCFYCGSSERITVDHDIPIARGGSDNIDNILPACKPCNCRKHTLTAAEFIATLGGYT